MQKKIIVFVTLLCFLSCSLNTGFAQLPSVQPDSAPLLIHIQDAHGNVTGQKNIARMIRRLAGTRIVSTLFVEGAFEQLDPKYLKFVKGKSENRKLISRLLSIGEITGVELALLKSKGSLKAYGIEDMNLYRKNLKLFHKFPIGKICPIVKYPRKIIDE